MAFISIKKYYIYKKLYMVDIGCKDEFLIRVKFYSPTKELYKNINNNINKIVDDLYGNERKICIIKINLDNFLRKNRIVLKTTVYHYSESKYYELSQIITEYISNIENCEIFK